MSPRFPPQDLECPDPPGCPVAVDRLSTLASTGGLPRTSFAPDHPWHRVYDARDGFGTANPGFGDTRFAPFDAVDGSGRVPTLYVAETLEAALLETSLHTVAEEQPREVAESSLLGALHAEVLPPTALTLVDLRDAQLSALQISRRSIASSSAEHYPCTRRVAQAIHGSTPASAGIVWHSRQAELNQQPASEVAVIFADRLPQGRDAWQLSPSRHAAGALLEGRGRLLLDELAEALDITVVTAEEF